MHWGSSNVQIPSLLKLYLPDHVLLGPGLNQDEGNVENVDHQQSPSRFLSQLIPILTFSAPPTNCCRLCRSSNLYWQNYITHGTNITKNAVDPLPPHTHALFQNFNANLRPHNAH